jgi:uncharacterized protein
MENGHRGLFSPIFVLAFVCIIGYFLSAYFITRSIMRLDRIIQTLLPHDEKFFAFFDESVLTLVKATELMKTFPGMTREERIDAAREIHELENQGDVITHKIFTELNSTFVTPFDREDIHAIASSLDDVLDTLYGTSSRMVLYKIGACPPEVQQLTEVLHKAAIELQRGIALLCDLRRTEDIQKVIHNVNEYENEADDIFEQGLANLFENEKDAILIAKIKEILVTLETATDKCDDVANVLETILIKHA